MKVTFLGTGTSQGVPVIACPCEVCRSSDPRDNRLRSSVLISEGGVNVVIDTGPDFRQQMLRASVKTLDAVVFTHEHKDHIAGLDDVRAFNYFSKKRMPVYCTNRVAGALKREFHYAFSNEQYPGIPEIDLMEIDINPFEAAGILFKPVQVGHMNMPVFGYRVGKFTYITDANFIPDEEVEKIMDSDVLVLNALRREKHPSHFNLEEALRLTERFRPKLAYFTHISHQLGRHEEVEKELPEGVHLAYDGLELDMDAVAEQFNTGRV